MTMAVPLSYNLRSALQRWRSSLVAMLGIAGTVGVFVAMLALARGFRATMAASGQPGNAIVLRGGADSEMMRIMTRQDVRVVSRAVHATERDVHPIDQERQATVKHVRRPCSACRRPCRTCRGPCSTCR